MANAPCATISFLTGKPMDYTVHIVDDDASVRRSLEWLFESVGLECMLYESGSEFLEKLPEQAPGCVLLDVRMPAMGGFEVQRELNSRSNAMPVIFLTAHGDIPMTVRALKAGAHDFLEKPYNDQVLIDKVTSALLWSAEAYKNIEQEQRDRESLAQLSARELEVFHEVLAGKANKVIAKDLDISLKTVEAHRAHIREKLGVHSVVEMLRMAGHRPAPKRGR